MYTAERNKLEDATHSAVTFLFIVAEHLCTRSIATTLKRKQMGKFCTIEYIIVFIYAEIISL
jgi:hypothetical protein